MNTRGTWLRTGAMLRRQFVPHRLTQHCARTSLALRALFAHGQAEWTDQLTERARRKPIKSKRRDGSKRLRFAARQYCAALKKLPPRTTRNSPS